MWNSHKSTWTCKMRMINIPNIWYKISPCSLGCPETYCIDQAALELKRDLSDWLQNVGTKGMSYHRLWLSKVLYHESPNVWNTLNFHHKIQISISHNSRSTGNTPYYPCHHQKLTQFGFRKGVKGKDRWEVNQLKCLLYKQEATISTPRTHVKGWVWWLVSGFSALRKRQTELWSFLASPSSDHQIQ